MLNQSLYCIIQYLAPNTKSKAGNILRKVYNCRDRKKFRPSNILTFPVKKMFHFPKFSDGLFISHLQKISISFISYVSTLPNTAGTTAQTNFLHHSFSKFHAFQHSLLRFSTVPVQNLQLQLHNSHFTTANCISQLHKLSSVARQNMPWSNSTKY